MRVKCSAENDKIFIHILVKISSSKHLEVNYFLNRSNLIEFTNKHKSFLSILVTTNLQLSFFFLIKLDKFFIYFNSQLLSNLIFTELDYYT